MPASPARLAANRANAGDPLGASTGPRTPDGKAASSRNALVHGAGHPLGGTDATILALDPAPTPATPTLDTSVSGPCPGTLWVPSVSGGIAAVPGGAAVSGGPAGGAAAPGGIGAVAGGPAAVAGVVAGGPAAADTPLPRLGEGPGVRGHLALYAAAFAPATPAEALYVERCALLAARLDLVQQALDALPILAARRALADHLREQYDHAHGGAQLRQNPNWTLALRQFDGTLPEDAAPDPRTLPDPELCALA